MTTKDTSRGTAAKQMAEYEALAEKAYLEMYDSRSPRVCYCDLKGYFADAIGAAEHRAYKLKRRGSEKEFSIASKSTEVSLETSDRAVQMRRMNALAAIQLSG